MGEEKPAEWYDGYLQKGDSTPLYKIVDGYLGLDSLILDLGCAEGRFAQYLHEHGVTAQAYVGMDFSSKRLEAARKALPDFCFLLGDIRSDNAKELMKLCHQVVLLEVLEHIRADREVLAMIPPFHSVIISVPNYNSAGHVRWFKDIQAVKARYADLIDFWTDETWDCSSTNKIFILEGVRRDEIKEAV